MSLPESSPSPSKKLKRSREPNASDQASSSSPKPSSATCSPTKNKKKKNKYANAPATLSLFTTTPNQNNEHNAPSSSSSTNPNGVQPEQERRAPSIVLSKLLNGGVDPRITESRKQLPIWSGKDAIIEAVRNNDTVVIVGETGSGKTTQIPQYLFEAGFVDQPTHSRRGMRVQMIGVTQPRRVAATSLARRVAVEMGQPDPAIPIHVNRSSNGKNKISRNAVAAEGGGLVGYSIRFEDRTSKNTRIKFMTDGMVLREMIGNTSRRPTVASLRSGDSSSSSSAKPMSQSHAATNRSSLLLKYSVLIIDEAHERTLRTDQVLGLAKRIQRERKALRQSWIARGSPADEFEITELKIIVMSATLDANRFANFFASPSKAFSASSLLSSLPTESIKLANSKTQVPILYVQGRQHKVDLYHTEEPVQEWMDAALRTVLQIHVSRPPGDILVFMTGQEEIESLTRSLTLYSSELTSWAEHTGKTLPVANLMIAPLYAALGASASTKVFSVTPPETRKVVLATNIAETSITIPNIVYVVDCGLAKEKFFTPTTHVESLQVTEISQSAAKQRSGRAGRTKNGECYRLYTHEDFSQLTNASTPEILRTDLVGATLQLCAMNQDPYTFDWLDQPDPTALQESVLQLIQLGALEIKSATSPSSTTAETNAKNTATTMLKLTEIGQKMAMLPVAPAYARSLVAASDAKGGGSARVARQVRDMIAILSADRSILVEPTDPERREEANRAKKTFAHPSGDHATLLNVFYTYLQQERSIRKTMDKHHNGNASKKKDNDKDGVKGKKQSIDQIEAKEQLKAWCLNHYVHEKAIKNVIHIRKQLQLICRQQGIACDDDEREEVNRRQRAKSAQGTIENKKLLNGGGDNAEQAASESESGSDKDSDSSSDSDDATSSIGDTSTFDDDDDDNEADVGERERQRAMKEGLYVVRKGISSSSSSSSSSSATADGGEQEDFTQLLKCILHGRMLQNVGIRKPDSNGRNPEFKKIGTGGMTFKLHPSSTLHATNIPTTSTTQNGVGVGMGAGSLDAIIFEELVFTTQTFARIVSRIQPAWLQELTTSTSSSRV